MATAIAGDARYGNLYYWNNAMKKYLSAILIFLCGVCSARAFSFGAGIFYPKVSFSFYNVNRNFDWGPANEACDMADENTPEINVLFRQPGNSFKAEFQPFFLTKKNYSRLYIKEIVYVYENNEYPALKDALFTLSSNIIDIRSYDKGWITNGTYYWMNGWEAEPENWKDKSKLWPETNFEKIFKGKKAGDKFSFSIRIVYAFDDEEEKTLVAPFTVTANKGRYTSPFAGL